MTDLSSMDDVIRDFLVESHENLDQLDRDLLSLEQNPASQERLASIFRTIHTIKGTCGFLGFGKLEKVTHAGENLLSSLRDGSIVLSGDIANGLLSLVDAVRQILANIETVGREGEQEFAGLIHNLVTLHEVALTGSAADSVSAPSKPKASVPEVAVSEVLPEDTATLPSVETPIKADQPTATAAPFTSQEGRSGNVADSTIRVDVGLLEGLMTRVGELVLARNQILQFINSSTDTVLQKTCQRLNVITTELQEGVMKTRMQPIGNVWSKFPRIVRDLAAICGKQVRLEMEGKETELDRTIIEAIKDPLTHLVRNTVDHGIEDSAQRIAKGKPAEGCLRLRAFHEGGQVNIEISDDGAGLNYDRIKQKAIERGIITREQSARMQDREAAGLIFVPGFSTAEKVTNVSGRGVGMDVVKTNIEKIGGTVDIQSVPQQGTAIRIKIPLTLAIIPALIVTSERENYAIPQVNLLELVRLDGDNAKQNIEWIQGASFYRLRGRLLPLVYLSDELKLVPAGVNSFEKRESFNIVVLLADDQQFGLVVDRINDTEEIVVKPLSKQLKGVPVFSGATIMGDGRVALILDVLGLAHTSRIISSARDRIPSESRKGDTQTTAQTKTLLIVGIGQQRRVAFPISQVSRLEQVLPASIERAGAQEVIQYRNHILPLIRLADVLGATTASKSESAPLDVIVYSENQRSAGLIVDQIIDIIEATVEQHNHLPEESLSGSAVIQGHVTDLLNLSAILRHVDPRFADSTLIKA
ncbi:MAG: chemotaxis protein CheA [Pirellulales bacterium]